MVGRSNFLPDRTARALDQRLSWGLVLNFRGCWSEAEGEDAVNGVPGVGVDAGGWFVKLKVVEEIILLLLIFRPNCDNWSAAEEEI